MEEKHGNKEETNFKIIELEYLRWAFWRYRWALLGVCLRQQSIHRRIGQSQIKLEYRHSINQGEHSPRIGGVMSSICVSVEAASP